MIYVYRPPVIFPTRDLSFNLTSKVSGMCGMGETECHSIITFEKNEYYLGEVAKVRVQVDNTNCTKDVSGIKFKLHRHSLGIDKDKWQSVGSNYLA